MKLLFLANSCLYYEPEHYKIPEITERDLLILQFKHKLISGIKQSALGRTRYLGSFYEFVDNRQH